MYLVRRISTELELITLKEQWTAMLAEVSNPSIFLTWEWVATWWRCFGQDETLWLLTAWDESRRLVGIAPWKLVYHPMGLRRIVFITDRPPVHLNVIARQDDEKAVCAVFQAYLDSKRDEWDVVDLEGIAENSEFRRPLVTTDSHFCALEGPISLSVFLPDEWHTYEKDTLSSRLGKNLRRLGRKLGRDYPGQVFYQRVTNTAELPSVLDSLIIMSRKRWQARGRKSAFADKRFTRFFRDISILALKQGWLRLYQLKVADQVVAVEHCFFFRNVLYAYQSSFNPEWHKYSPTSLLQAHSIKQGIAEGAQEYNMLRGTESYKFAWVDQVHTNSHILFSASWMGLVWVLRAISMKKALRIGRSVLPQMLREKINYSFSVWRAQVLMRNGTRYGLKRIPDNSGLGQDIY